MSERPDYKVSLRDSPRAVGSVRRMKARGGLVGFAIGALSVWMHGSATFSVVVRGLEGGLAGYLVCWFAAVTTWRAVIRAEVRAAVNQAVERRDARPVTRPASPAGAPE